METQAITHDERVEYEMRILATEMETVRLRRALAPFAAKASSWEANHKYQARDSQQISHRLGDFREARKLIGRDDNED